MLLRQPGKIHLDYGNGDVLIFIRISASLEDVYVLARTVSENLVSIGASLSHVHVPGRETIDMGEDDLKISEVEIGMGIHNEPGSERRTEDLPSLVNFMLARLLDEADKDRNFLGISSNDEVVLLVNNLGGVSVLEMGGITNEIVSQLQADYRIKPKRVISGTFMTSLNGLGFSITLLKLQETGLFGGKSMLELLDSPSEALGWSTPVSTETWNSTSTRQSANIETDDGVSRQSNLTSMLMLLPLSKTIYTLTPEKLTGTGRIKHYGVVSTESLKPNPILLVSTR